MHKCLQKERKKYANEKNVKKQKRQNCAKCVKHEKFEKITKITKVKNCEKFRSCELLKKSTFEKLKNKKFKSVK